MMPKTFCLEADFRWEESAEKEFKSMRDALQWAMDNSIGMVTLIIGEHVSDD